MSTFTTEWLLFSDVSQSGSGTVWSNPQRVLLPTSAINAGASANNLPGGSSSQDLDVTGIVLPSSVPDGWQLAGIEFGVARKQDLTSAGFIMVDDELRLLVGSNPAGDNRATADTYPADFTERLTGGTDDLWGSSVARSDIGAGFGVRIRTRNTSTKTARTARLSGARVRFTFVDASSGGDPDPDPEPPENIAVIRFGANIPDRLYLGANQVDAAYLGSTKIFEKPT